jgi:hypothetical protein
VKHFVQSAVVIQIFHMCVRCDHLLAGDEVEYLYKGKSYCDDSYRMSKKAVTDKQNRVQVMDQGIGLRRSLNDEGELDLYSEK